ncbi:MAG: nucleoside-triphosphatase, partial [Halobacteriota archaeon]
GLFSPERRDGDGRTGFDLVDIASGDRVTMASTSFERGPSVGKYRVDVEAVDAIVERALVPSIEGAAVFLVDEIAPMECHSDRFVRAIRRLLDDDRPTVATIHRRSTGGFIGEVKRRPDTHTIEVTEANRDDLPLTLLEDLLAQT